MADNENNGEDNINSIAATLRILLTKINNFENVLGQMKKDQDDHSIKIQEIMNVEINQQNQAQIVQQNQQQINNVREDLPIKVFSNKNKKDCEINTIFQLFEANNKHQGTDVREIGKRLSYHFNGEALSTFMGRFETYISYNEMKTYMINCFDHHTLFSPEDELLNLKDTNFKKFSEFLLKFERLRSKCGNITEKRAIELFINSISNKEIRKNLYTRNVNRLEDAVQEALYEFKENGKRYYSPLSDDNETKSQEPMDINTINKPTNNNNSNNNKNSFKKKSFNNYNNYNNKNNNKNDNKNQEKDKKEIRCFNCGQTGHYKNQCKLTVMVISPTTENLNAIDDNTTKVSVAGVFKINKTLTKCLVDTGAAITVVNYEFCKKLNIEITNGPTSCKVDNHSNLNIIGTVELEIFFGKPHKITQVYVSKELPYNCLIGYDSLKTMNAVIDTVDDILFYKHNPKYSINLLPSCNINLVGQAINQINPTTDENNNNNNKDNNNTHLKTSQLY
ncbi:hypothetical protein ACTFIU_004375 [Dictyostelium citrinum]